MAIAETSSVRRSPARSSSPFSVMNDQSKVIASAVVMCVEEQPPERPLLSAY